MFGGPFFPISSAQTEHALNLGARIRKDEVIPMNAPALLTLSGVSCHPILDGIHASWTGGEMIGIVGPNGAGKSTLLRILAGSRRADRGEILINNRNLPALPAKQRAKEIAYLPQQIPDQVPYTVLEYVEMGRYAYRKAWGGLSKECRKSVEEALLITELIPYKHIQLMNMSGGERQRASIARCLAQGSKVILLDEPIASLDLYYQLEILRQLKQLADSGYLIVIVLHNLELAARYCSRLLILKEGRSYGHGVPQEVITERTLSEVFHVRTQISTDPYGGYLRISLLQNPT